MNYGNALSNANRFEESLQVLAAAMERLEADANADAEAVEHVKGAASASAAASLRAVTSFLQIQPDARCTVKPR